MKRIIETDENNRIILLTDPEFSTNKSIIIENEDVPGGNLRDYKYINGEFVYSPIEEI